MKIPNGEKLLVTLHYGGRHYMITRTADNSGYIGYEMIDDKLKKLGKRKSPLEVEELFKSGEGENQGCAKAKSGRVEEGENKKGVKTRTKKMG